MKMNGTHYYLIHIIIVMVKIFLITASRFYLCPNAVQPQSHVKLQKLNKISIRKKSGQGLRDSLWIQYKVLSPSINA